jgi:uncharacterized membrane protein YphA (DoxX/SURF4 family)
MSVWNNGAKAMYKKAAHVVALWFCLTSLAITPALSHVKWFLDRSEADILRDPKPELFTSPSPLNLVPIGLALLTLFLSTLIGREFSSWIVNQKLSRCAQQCEPWINLVIGLFLGGFLIYCSLNGILLAPNFIICAHCPWWLPYVECFAGCTLLFGLFARVGGGLVLGLLVFTFLKHSAADCLDLVPLYGLAIYFVLCGRDRLSLDGLLGIDLRPDANTIELAHLMIRWSMGIGLMILALDEKLLHPQLALELLKHSPSLNFAACLHLSNAMFVLCAGLTEIILGLVIVVGSFPRAAMIMLAGLFITTTFIFGSLELFGHMSFYGIIVAISLRGAGLKPPLAVLKTAYSGVLEKLFQPAKQPA